MKLVFSNHALIKMKQRRISKRLVLFAVNNPDLVRFSDPDKREVYKKFKKLYLKVVVAQGVAITVVTTHWVEKLK